MLPSLVLAIAWLRSAADGAPSVDALLRQLITGSRTANMRGKQVSVITAGGSVGRPCVQRVVRRRDGRILTVCLEPAEQRNAGTMDDGIWHKSWDASKRSLSLSRAMPRVVGERAIRRMLRLIHRNYHVAYETKEVFSDRLCYRLSFTPRSLLSHPVRVWLDVDHGVVLGHQENDRKGNTLCLTFFATAEFPRQIALSEVQTPVSANAKIRNNSRSRLLRSIGELRRRAGFPVTVPLDMPAGYQFEHGEVLNLRGRTHVCLHYTDGLSNISILESRAVVRQAADFREPEPLRDLAPDMVGVQYTNEGMEYAIVGHGEVGGMMAIASSLDPLAERAWLAALAQRYHVSSSSLAALRDAGIGVRAIYALLHVAAQSGRPLRTLADLYRDGWSLEGIARRFRVDVSAIPHVLQRVQHR